MLTRCPECGTLYRVRPEPLDASGGQVRCGECGQVFDARFCSEDSAPPGVGLLAEASAGPAESPRHAPTTASGEQHPPERTATSARRGGWVWALGSLLLALALVVQGLWWERERLAAHPEGLRLLQALCTLAPCRAEPPRAPRQIEVQEHGLTSLPDRPDALRLHLVITNRAPHPQPWPILDLELLNRLGQTLAVRRFRPADYLPRTDPPGSRLDVGQTGEIAIELMAPEGGSGGYRFDLL